MRYFIALSREGKALLSSERPSRKQAVALATEWLKWPGARYVTINDEKTGKDDRFMPGEQVR